MSDMTTKRFNLINQECGNFGSGKQYVAWAILEITYKYKPTSKFIYLRYMKVLTIYSV